MQYISAAGGVPIKLGTNSTHTCTAIRRDNSRIKFKVPEQVNLVVETRRWRAVLEKP